MLPGPLESDKKLAKAAPIFLSMLKSETREETADAVIKAATAALGAHITTQFNCFTAKKIKLHTPSSKRRQATAALGTQFFSEFTRFASTKAKKKDADATKWQRWRKVLILLALLARNRKY